MRFIYMALVAIFITACGGGGDSSPNVPPTGHYGAALTAIALYGNSVMHGTTTEQGVVRSPNAPVFVLRKQFPNIDIVDYSVDGSSVMGMRNSSFWPPSTCPSHSLFLHYHNDNSGTLASQLNAMLSESCSPVKILIIANQVSTGSPPAWSYIYGNSEVVRKVAQERGVKLCDSELAETHNSVDMIHPSDYGYSLLGSKLIQCINDTM